jgi:hypothetical protein
MSEPTIETLDLGTDESLRLALDAGMRLYVDDERVWAVNALDQGVVALTTGIRTVHISAADYWRLLHGAAHPSAQEAGHLAAQLAQVKSYAAQLIDQLARQGLIDYQAYPDIWGRVAALRIALGMPEATQLVEQ